MSRLILSLLFILTLQTTVFAQKSTEERQKKEYEEKVEEQKQKFIQDFLSTLDIDAFQKEIIDQHMYSYFDEALKIQNLNLKSYEMKDELDKMRARHFIDVKAIVSEEIMQKIDDAVTGKWDPKKEKKKRKKSKRNN